MARVDEGQTKLFASLKTTPRPLPVIVLSDLKARAR